MRKILAFLILYRLGLTIWQFRFIVIAILLPLYICGVASQGFEEESGPLETRESPTQLSITNRRNRIPIEVDEVGDRRRKYLIKVFQTVQSHRDLVLAGVFLIWNSELLENYSDLIVNILRQILKEWMQYMDVAGYISSQLIARFRAENRPYQINNLQQFPRRLNYQNQRFQSCSSASGIWRSRLTPAQTRDLDRLVARFYQSISSFPLKFKLLFVRRRLLSPTWKSLEKISPFYWKEPAWAGEFEQYLQDRAIREIYCPITHDLFINPVVAADGFTYECDAIQRWMLQANSNALISPMTGEHIASFDLVANKTVKNIIVSYRDRFIAEKESIQNMNLRRNQQVKAPASGKRAPNNGKRSLRITSNTPLESLWERTANIRTYFQSRLSSHLSSLSVARVLGVAYLHRQNDEEQYASLGPS